LSEPGEEIKCSTCGRVGSYIDGIPCFTDPSYYWGEIPLERMQEANRLAAEVGWRAAVERVTLDEPMRDYICAPWRADFQKLWNLGPNSAVLDVGAGWGGISAALAANFSRVVAVEGVLERTRFIRQRARQENLPLETVCADFLRLPLAPGQFDVVVLNGVLEWVGLANRNGDPRDLQVAFLRAVRKLLKPSGFLCVGIENRIALAYFRGVRDHSGLRYTSLMPRAMADRACRWFSRRHRSDVNVGYRIYTYSLPGYRKLFQDAGLGAARAFHAWHGYNVPTVLLPLEGDRALLDFVDSQEWRRSGLRGRIKDIAYRIAARTGLWRQFASEYSFLVERN
jgi:2-polyprenyl-3-methyl-5-hydroxy-6-metoxy-1,4-benzoquinol methylase